MRITYKQQQRVQELMHWWHAQVSSLRQKQLAVMKKYDEKRSERARMAIKKTIGQ